MPKRAAEYALDRAVKRMRTNGASLAMVNPYAKYAALGVKYGLPAAAYAGRVISRSFRRYRRRRFSKEMQFFGHNVGSGNCKRNNVSEFDDQAFNSRTQYEFDLTQIARTSTNEIQNRQRDLLNIRGVRICMNITNTGTQPLFFNVAVITPKFGEAISTVDFFRSFGSTRSTDFATTLSPLQFHCLPINTDRYAIAWHARYTIGTANGGTSYSNEHIPNYKTIMKYVPIKRQQRFDNTDVGAAERPFFLVYWADFMGVLASSSAVACGTVQQDIVTYFRETAN